MYTLGWRGCALAKLALVGAFVLAVFGCTDAYNIETTAPTSSLPARTTLNAATVASGGVDGTSLGQGLGNSMQPLYGDNTIFLIAPIDFEDLQPGMHVAYLDPFGTQIVHRLRFLTDAGWVVEGVNNATPDRYRVTRENLVGVVYGSFQSDLPSQDQ